LQELQLAQLDLQWLPAGLLMADAEVSAEAKADGIETVAAAIASLPCLQRLSLAKLPLSLKATATLAKAAAGTQVTQLTLEACGVRGAGLTALAVGLSNLREVNVDVVGDATAAMPALARLTLRQLRLGAEYKCSIDVLDVFLPGWRKLMTFRPMPSWPPAW
jgi:hypothetical protein